MNGILGAGIRLLAAYSVLGALAVATVLLVPIRADMSVLLPESGRGEIGALFTSLRDGPANRTILISLARADDEEPLAAPRALSNAFRKELEGLGRFEVVVNGAVTFDAATLDPFFDHRFRLNPPLNPETFSANGLTTALQHLLRELRGFSGGVLQGIMGADPTLRTLEIARLWQPASMTKRQGVWVDGQGTHVLLLARTRSKGFDLATQAATIEDMRQAAKRLEATFGPLDLELSGPSVIAVASRNVAENESLRLILVSVPLVAGLLILFLRRFSALPILFLPLGTAFVVATAVTAVVFGDVHVTTLGFGVTLLGIAVDYPLHLMAHVRAGQRPATAARRIWGALLIAATTTGLAFIPLAGSSFPGLSQLGIFTVVGLATAVMVTRWVLPVLIRPTGQTDADWGTDTPSSVHRAMRLGRGVALVIGAVALGLLLLRQAPLWQQDLAALSPVPEDLKMRDRDLRRDLNVADPRYILTIAGRTVEDALQLSEALLPHLRKFKEDGGVEDFETVALFLPSGSRQAKTFRALPSDAALRRNLETALRGTSFKPGTFEPFLQSIAEARKGAPLSLLDLSDSPLYTRLSPMVIATENGVKLLVLLRQVRNPAELRGMIEESGVDQVAFLDLKGSAQVALDGYRAETLHWVAVGAALALAMLILTLRSLRGVFAVAAPVVLAVLVTAAAVAMIAGSLSIFHLLGLLMVGGLGIDYAVFLRQSSLRFGDAVDASAAIRAVSLCALTSFSVFALLATAAVPVLSQIGMTVAIGTVLALLFGLAFTAPERARTL